MALANLGGSGGGRVITSPSAPAPAQEIAQRVQQPVWRPSPQPTWTPPMAAPQPQPVAPRNPPLDSWRSVGDWWNRLRTSSIEHENRRRAALGTGTTPSESWRNALDWVTTVPDATAERRAASGSAGRGPLLKAEEEHVLPLPQVNEQTIGVLAQGFVPPSEVSPSGPIMSLNAPTEFWWDTPEAKRAVKRYRRENRDRKEEVVPLTWEAYDAMTPEEQAAVQWNDTLYQAIERDRKQQENYDFNDEQNKAYWDAVDEVFGATVFPEVKGLRLAPETVKVLQQLDIPSYEQSGKGLDDYLRFDTAISDKMLGQLDTQLPALQFGPPPVSGDTSGYEYSPREQRINMAQQLTSAQQKLNETLANGDVVLANAAARMANAGVEEVGGIERRLRMRPPGDYPQVYFDQYLQALADPANENVAGTWQLIQDDIAMEARSPKEAEQVQKALLNNIEAYATGSLDWTGIADASIPRVRPIQEVLAGLQIPTVAQPKGKD